MNIEKIKKRTNQLIGYENFEREEKEKMKKIRNILLSIGIFVVFLAGGFTVNALSDNGIVNGIKEALNLNIKINGEEKNATCKEMENGNIKCTVDKEVLGEDAKVEIEYNKEYQGDFEFEAKIEEGTTELSTIIKE